MTVASEKNVLTDQEFMALPDDGGHYELVNGEDVTPGFRLSVAELFAELDF